MVEELLRFDATTPFVSRVTTADVPVGGAVIPAGAPVLVLLDAANRDERRFTCPHAFAPERRPNPHLGFGAGPHACPGAGLARATLQIAIGALLHRFPALQLDGQAVWREEVNVRGLVSLPVSFGG